MRRGRSVGHDRLGGPAGTMVLAAVYVVVARLGLILEAVGGGFATLVWPATGLSLAALVLYGRRLWPGITVGAFVANILTGASIPVALGIATGNTLEAVVGAYALQKIAGARFSLDKLRHVLALIVFAAVGSTMLSASVGLGSLLAGGVVALDAASETWVAWWLGDLIGALLVTPLLVTWATPPREHDPPPRPLETVAVAATILGMTALIYGSPPGTIGPMATFRQSYVFFPVLIWATLRLGQREAITTMFAMVALAIAGTALGRGPFVGPSLHASLLSLQAFMALSAATFLVLMASISERRKAANELRAVQEGLEATVRARTADLIAVNADLVHAHDELRKGRHELELRVEQRTAEIRKLLADLEEAVRARDSLISIASHELRTPLSALQLQVLLIDRELRKVSSDNGPVLAPRIAAVDRQVARLARLVENLLDVSRITAGKLQLEYEDVDMASTVRDVISRFEDEARRSGSSFDLRASAPVVGRWDRMRLEQIVTNLVSNALKYGGDEPIEITVGERDGRARLVVRDHGIGIARDDQARIFERFERLVSDKHAGGFGLGLWIVREIVDALGGTIEVESHLGEGTTFVVSLPRSPNEKRVLVVEDDPDVLDALTGALRAEGYEVESAVNGVKAMESLRGAHPPSVILLDLMMPEMDGAQFLNQKQNASDVADIPVVLISADSQLARKAAELHVDDYLQKPVRLDTLLSTVARHCAIDPGTPIEIKG